MLLLILLQLKLLAKKLQQVIHVKKPMLKIEVNFPAIKQHALKLQSLLSVPHPVHRPKRLVFVLSMWCANILQIIKLFTWLQNAHFFINIFNFFINKQWSIFYQKYLLSSLVISEKTKEKKKKTKYSCPSVRRIDSLLSNLNLEHYTMFMFISICSRLFTHR